MVSEIDPYFRSGEINSRVESISDKLEAVAQAFSEGEADHEDGLTVQHDDFWFNLRPSNTEPLLRLNVEANNEKLLDETTASLLEIIRA